MDNSKNNEFRHLLAERRDRRRKAMLLEANKPKATLMPIQISHSSDDVVPGTACCKHLFIRRGKLSKAIAHLEGVSDSSAQGYVGLCHKDVRTGIVTINKIPISTGGGAFASLNLDIVEGDMVHLEVHSGNTELKINSMTLAMESTHKKQDIVVMDE